MSTAEEPTPQLTPEQRCRNCRTSMEVTCAVLIVGGVIILAPEELTIAAIVSALAALGLMFGADTVRKWITQAAKDGISDVQALALYICKNAGACS